MKKSSSAYSVLVGICLIFSLSDAYAGCAFTSGVKSGNVTFALPPLASPLNPSDSTSRKLNTVTLSAATLASAMGADPTAALWNGCTGSLIWNPLRGAVAGSTPEGSGLISTGIDNLYFYLYAGSKTTGNFGPFLTPTTQGAAWSRALSTIHGSIPPWTILGDVVMVLYQTGPVRQGGTIPAGPVAELKLSDGLQIMTMSTSALTVDVMACTLTTPVVNVAMPAMFKSSFTKAGTTSNEKAFKISANCDSGVMPVITFTGVGSEAGNDIFAINSGTGTAEGLGIQLLTSGQTIVQNQPVALGTIITSGVNEFPFSARYIQTADKVTSGNVDATITFTLAYK